MSNSSYHVLFIVNLISSGQFLFISCCSVFADFLHFSLKILERNSNLPFSVLKWLIFKYKRQKVINPITFTLFGLAGKDYTSMKKVKIGSVSVQHKIT